MAVGGRGTLFGAVIGAMLVNYAKTYFTGAFAELWLFMLGGLFVLTTLYLPKGVVGLWAQLKEKYLLKKQKALLLSPQDQSSVVTNDEPGSEKPVGEKA